MCLGFHFWRLERGGLCLVDMWVRRGCLVERLRGTSAVIRCSSLIMLADPLSCITVGSLHLSFAGLGLIFFSPSDLLKQIPSGVGRGFSWGRTKQVMAYPTPSLRPITKDEFLSAGLNHTEKWWEEDSRSYQQRERYRLYPYPDAERPGAVRGANDVEADMLANAKDDGWAIQPATSEVRRRAAVERGVRPYFHGGVISALCIDLKCVFPSALRSFDLNLASLTEQLPIYSLFLSIVGRIRRRNIVKRIQSVNLQTKRHRMSLVSIGVTPRSKSFSGLPMIC